MNLLEAPICAKAVARLRSKGWRVGCEIRRGTPIPKAVEMALKLVEEQEKG